MYIRSTYLWGLVSGSLGGLNREGPDTYQKVKPNKCHRFIYKLNLTWKQCAMTNMRRFVLAAKHPPHSCSTVQSRLACVHYVKDSVEPCSLCAKTRSSKCSICKALHLSKLKSPVPAEAGVGIHSSASDAAISVFLNATQNFGDNCRFTDSSLRPPYVSKHGQLQYWGRGSAQSNGIC